MPRYKPYDYNQGQFIPIQFEKQIQPGSFEYALDFIVDHKLNISAFENRIMNDETGAPAYDPKILLKVIIYAYSHGVLHSREIERACQENVMYMALSANTRPHFTTIAHFISHLSDGIEDLFLSVLLYCDRLKLIGKDMFAIDGCKISSNASKEWSGTRADFERKKEKYKEGISYLLKKHRAEDKIGEKEPTMRKKEEKARKNMKERIDQIEEWLGENEDKVGSEGNIKKSHMIDNESAKMVSSHGVIQGYNGIAAVDGKHQVIVGAEAEGERIETQSLEPMLDQIEKRFQKMKNAPIYKEVTITADSGFFSEKNMQMLNERKVNAYIADNRFRKRDPQFDTANRHKKPVDRHKGAKRPKKRYFSPDDFQLNKETGKLICPAGKELYVKNRNFRTAQGMWGTTYMSKKTDCRVCEIRSKCLRHDHTKARQVAKFEGSDKSDKASFSQWMRNRIDTLKGRYLYSRRMGIAEPPFANIRDKIGLNRFTMRGKRKNSAQWKMFTMVHNILKIYRYGGPQVGFT